MAHLRLDCVRAGFRQPASRGEISYRRSLTPTRVRSVGRMLRTLSALHPTILLLPDGIVFTELVNSRNVGKLRLPSGLAESATVGTGSIWETRAAAAGVFRVPRDSPKISGSATEFPFPQWSLRFECCFSERVLLGPRNPRLH